MMEEPLIRETKRELPKRMLRGKNRSSLLFSTLHGTEFQLQRKDQTSESNAYFSQRKQFKTSEFFRTELTPLISFV